MNTGTAQGVQRPVLSVPEAAELLGISRGSAYRAVRSGELPSIRIGKLFLIPRAAFERLLDPDQNATNGGVNVP